MVDEIETRDLILRPLRYADAARIVALIGDFRVTQNLARVPHPYHMSDAHEFLEWQATFDERSCFRALCLKSAPEDLIGIISYEYVAAKKDAELGYWLGVEYWGRGLMSQAARAMVERAFRVSKVGKLVSCYFTGNPVSGRILRGIGLEELGPCTAFSKAQNREVPVVNLAVSAERWLEKFGQN